MFCYVSEEHAYASKPFHWSLTQTLELPQLSGSPNRLDEQDKDSPITSGEMRNTFKQADMQPPLLLPRNHGNVPRAKTRKFSLQAYHPQHISYRLTLPARRTASILASLKTGTR